jgi:hypothetical protein
MSLIPQEILLRLFGMEKEQRDVLRIVDGNTPRIDFVDLGANGEGETGFLVKKGRKMLGKLTVNKDGTFGFVAKGADGETGDEKDTALKMSAKAKADLAAKLAAITKAVADAEEDDSIDGLPDELNALLAGMATKAAEPPAEEPPKAEPDPAPAADDGTFKVGDMTLDGDLAKMAKAIYEKAGDRAESDEFQAEMVEKFAPLVELLDPQTHKTQQVAKRLDGEMAEIRKAMADLKAENDSLKAGMFNPLVIPSGAPEGQPIKKKRTPRLLPGQDIGEAAKNGDFDFIPQD